jgi:serine/threonine-protein kinase RsbT
MPIMAVTRSDVLPVRTEQDIVMARQMVRKLTRELAFGLVDQTKMVTAASELARNTVVYGGGGTMTYEIVLEGARRGLRLTFEDHGPGIADLSLAMKDGWTSGTGMGLGLSGAKRLVNEFDIQSQPGEGTRVTITRWK